MPLTTCSGKRRWRQRPRTTSNRQPVSRIIDDGYNLGMPSVRLTIIVRLDQAASLDRLEEFVEERRTLIGTDVSLLLSATDHGRGHWSGASRCASCLAIGKPTVA